MQIKLRESGSADTTRSEVRRYNINLSNVFDLKAITKELSLDNIYIDIGVKRHIKEDLWALPVTIPYAGVNTFVHDGKFAAKVYLYADYADRTAFAMSKEGADKRLMLTVATTANKYVREPFVLDSCIRDKI